MKATEQRNRQLMAARHKGLQIAVQFEQSEKALAALMQLNAAIKNVQLGSYACAVIWLEDTTNIQALTEALGITATSVLPDTRANNQVVSFRLEGALVCCAQPLNKTLIN